MDIQAKSWNSNQCLFQAQFQYSQNTFLQKEIESFIFSKYFLVFSEFFNTFFSATNFLLAYLTQPLLCYDPAVIY